PPSGRTPRLAAATLPRLTSISAPTISCPSTLLPTLRAMLRPGGSVRSIQSALRTGGKRGRNSATSNTASTENGFITTRYERWPCWVSESAVYHVREAAGAHGSTPRPLDGGAARRSQPAAAHTAARTHIAIVRGSCAPYRMETEGPLTGNEVAHPNARAGWSVRPSTVHASSNSVETTATFPPPVAPDQPPSTCGSGTTGTAVSRWVAAGWPAERRFAVFAFAARTAAGGRNVSFTQIARPAAGTTS